MKKNAVKNAVKTCATCRFKAANRKKEVHATCMRIHHVYEVPDPVSPGLLGGDPSNEKAVVTDASGYSARLLVLPTFGCVLHEEKSDANE